MKIADYFEPYVFDSSLQSDENLGVVIEQYRANEKLDLSVYDLFIMGVPEGRLSLDNQGCALAPKEIRKELYDLYVGDWTLKILDIGDLKIGHSVEDTYLVLKSMSHFFAKKNKPLLILGGGHDLITPLFQGYSNFGKPLSFASADAYLDFQDPEAYHSRSFLTKLLSSSSSLLSKYTLFAYQSYLCAPTEVSLLKNMDFNLIRLGVFNQDYSELEPYVRDLDHLSIDLSVMRASDSPATNYSSPNGISAEAICSLLRYAGMSQGIKSVLFSELNPSLDKNSQSSKVYAQAIWYFMEGLQLRYDDFPDLNSENFKKFHVNAGFSELIFYKSNSSGRWWVELISANNNSNISLLPCSVNDYNKALEGLISERLLTQLKF
tara:strand:- start:188 stop:1321 length:1134 start_codon:yes stop_codon:yes gene_type:complete